VELFTAFDSGEFSPYSNSVEIFFFLPAVCLNLPPNAFVKKSEIEKPVIFTALEGALCRASLDEAILFPLGRTLIQATFF
jgi:hypothetical protein